MFVCLTLCRSTHSKYIHLFNINKYLHYTLYTIHCTLYTVHYILYTLHCTLYTVHCAPLFILFTVTVPPFYTTKCTLYPLFMLFTVTVPLIYTVHLYLCCKLYTLYTPYLHYTLYLAPPPLYFDVHKKSKKVT